MWLCELLLCLRPQLQVAQVLPLAKWAGEGAVSVFSLCFLLLNVVFALG